MLVRSIMPKWWTKQANAPEIVVMKLLDGEGGFTTACSGKACPKNGAASQAGDVDLIRQGKANAREFGR